MLRALSVAVAGRVCRAGGAHDRGCAGAGRQREHRGHRPRHDRRRAARGHRDGDEHGHRDGPDVGDQRRRACIAPCCCRSAAIVIVAELQGFKTFEQQGITLSAGQTALINLELGVGNVSETVTVTSESPVAQPGKIDLGRTIGENEIRNLPLVSRNPYNFAFLQANVTGYENNEFGVPRINANGTQMRTNYQIDGNTNTEKDRAGLRLLPVSEVLVREVKVITNGFAPEFGQTTGMVYNAITPSGTNRLDGSASFRFRRNDMSSRPFFLAPTARKPDTEVNDFTADARRPRRQGQDGTTTAPTSTSTGASSRATRSSPSRRLRRRRSGSTCRASGVIPAHQKVNFLFGKTDYQINAANRLSARYFLFKNFSLSNIAGGLTTPDRATDFTDRMDSASAQLVSTLGGDKLNELRVQYARRHQFRTLSDTAVDGPAITVTGVANFGGPRIGDTNSVGFDFNQGIWQVIDNLTWVRGKHSFKAGIDAQFIADDRVRGERFFYTFPTNDAYLGARSGVDAVQLHLAAAGLRRPHGRLRFGLLRVLRPGRLAVELADEAALRPALRPVRRAVGADVRAESVFAGLHHRQEQRRTARRVLVVARRPRDDGAARVDGADVRAAAHRFLRQRDSRQRRSAGLHGDRRRHRCRRAGVSHEPRERARGLRAAAPEHHGGRSGLRDAVRLAHERADRAGPSERHVDRGRIRQLDWPQPAGVDGRQHDSDRTGARRRPTGLLDDGQSGDARRSDVRSRQRIPVDRRVHLQRVHGDLQQAHDPRVAGAGDLHVRARRGQRAPDRHLRRRQRRRSRVRSLEPRSREGRHPVPPDAHVRGVDASSRRRSPATV